MFTGLAPRGRGGPSSRRGRRRRHRARLRRGCRELAHQRDLPGQADARRLEAERACVRLRGEQRMHVAEVLVGRRIARIEADRLLQLGARLAVVAGRGVDRGEVVVRLGELGIVLDELLRMACASALRPMSARMTDFRNRICASLGWLASARSTRSSAAAVWPAWCSRVASLRSSAIAARAGMAKAVQRSNPAAKILNCIGWEGALGRCRERLFTSGRTAILNRL